MEIYKLTGETIDMLSDKIAEMYKETGCTKKEILRAKLLLEEALLKYRSRFGEDIELTFRSYKIFRQYRFSVRLKAPSFDPFTLEENPMAFMIQNIMTSFENGMPTWKYRNLENEIVFTIRKKEKIGSLPKILFSILGSLVIGIIARLIFSAEDLSYFVTGYVDPLADAYSGLFCVMAVLLTFFAISLSIVHIGDMAAIGALGGKIMRRFFIATTIVVIVLTLPVLPFFDLGGVGTFTVAVKSIYDILIDFIPTNIVTPFINFNSVQIMIIGAMFGLALLTMGQKGTGLVEVFDQCNLVAVYTNNFLNKFIFLYAALKLFSITATTDFTTLSGAGKMIGFILLAEIILVIIYTLLTCLRAKISVRELVKAVTPASLVCLSSANFGAAFSTIFDTILGSGVDNDTASLAVNLGGVFFQPASTVSIIISAIFMAAEYNVEISIVWVIMAMLLSIILVSSVPNIPGAYVSVIALLYPQLGIPNEGLALMITINALLQFVTVAVDIWCLQSEIICLRKPQKAEG